MQDAIIDEIVLLKTSLDRALSDDNVSNYIVPIRDYNVLG